MEVIKYDKLVRDRIPQIIEESGKRAVTEKLDDGIYKKYLDNKLGEELQEYISSNSIEELADLVEVVYAILKFRGVDINEFEDVRRKKALERGTFDKRLLLKEVVKD